MSETSIDVLMKVVGTTDAYAAESATVFSADATEDTLRDGFTAGKFCELKSFSFSAGAESALKPDKDGQESGKEADAKFDMGSFGRTSEKPSDKPSGKPAEKPSVKRLSYTDQIRSVYAGQRDKREAREKNDPVDMAPVEFTRIMDSMSIQLYTALAKCTTLASLSIVKRKATGNLASSGLCYLRMDFSSVLITSLGWKESQHVMMETGTFIYRKLTLQYRPQAVDGTLGVPIQTSWQMQAARNAGAL